MKKISKLMGKLFLTGMFVMPALTNLSSEQNYNPPENNKDKEAMIWALQTFQTFQRAYRNHSKFSFAIYKEIMPGSNKIFFSIAYDLDGDKKIDIVEMYHGQKYAQNNKTELYVNDNPFLYLIDRNQNGIFESGEILYDPLEDLLNFNEIF